MMPFSVQRLAQRRVLLRVTAFVRAVWAGLAQIYFQPAAAVGIAFFAILLLADSRAALCGLAGSVAATLAAWALRLPRPARHAGLYSYNGALCGIALGALFTANTALFVWLGWCAAASVVLTHLLARRRIPALTGPFVLLMLLTHYAAQGLSLLPRNAGAACGGNGLGFAFCSIGQVIFIAPLVLGLLMWYVLALRDSRTTAWALAGGVFAWLLALLASRVWPAAAAQAGGIGVNGVLAALGLAVFGFSPAVRLAGVAAATVLCLALGQLPMPYFTLPFNLAVWGILGLAARRRCKPYPGKPG